VKLKVKNNRRRKRKDLNRRRKRKDLNRRRKRKDLNRRIEKLLLIVLRKKFMKL